MNCTTRGLLPLCFITLVMSATAPALADDFYVNGASGNDAYRGTTPQQPWRTITHALTVVRNPPAGEMHTIHVAPGTYTSSPREVFPLQLRPGFALVGDKGSARTLIDGEDTDTALVQLLPCTNPGALDCWGPMPEKGGASPFPDPTQNARVEGFSMRAGSYGIWASASEGEVGVTLRDLDLFEMSYSGLGFEAVGAPITAHLDNVRANNNFYVGFVAQAGDAQARFTVVDSEFCDNGMIGVATLYGVHFVAERSCITGNGVVGLHAKAANGNGTYLKLKDTLVANNLHHGLNGYAEDQASPLWVELERCTFSGHGLDSPYGFAVHMYDATVRVESSILYGNLGDFYDWTVVQSIQNSDLEYWDFGGTDGNFSADPLFVDPENGDYRLCFGSPAIDKGSLATPAGTDLDGLPRVIDGNLNTHRRADVGALEFAPLRLAQEPVIGGKLILECWGPGNASNLFVSPLRLVDPMPTPFGKCELDRSRTSYLMTTRTGATSPAMLERSIPRDASLLGLTLSFQGMTESPAAYYGWAFTNAVSFVLHY